MELAANLTSAELDPVAWARTREAEGWDVLTVADHLWSDRRAFPHLWVTLTAVAMASERATVGSAFANNLFRSPVEFAQAALALQQLSGGRFEAGLGAGWTEDEMVRTGRRYPPAGERAAMYVEAVQIVHALLHDGRCDFHGEHYEVSVDRIAPRPAVPPKLVGAVGGAKTIAGATPFLDVAEVKPASVATRGGKLDFAALGTVTPDHLRWLVASVKERKPDVKVSCFVLCSAGTDERSTALAGLFPPDSFYGRFFGEPAKVADALLALADEGIERVQVSPIVDESYTLLAQELAAARA